MEVVHERGVFFSQAVRVHALRLLTNSSVPFSVAIHGLKFHAACGVWFEYLRLVVSLPGLLDSPAVRKPIAFVVRSVVSGISIRKFTRVVACFIITVVGAALDCLV